MKKNSQSYTYFSFPTLQANDALDLFVALAHQRKAIPLQHLHA